MAVPGVVRRPVLAALVSVGLVLAAAQGLAAATSPADDALTRINFYREAAGVNALLRHQLLEKAAANHANYFLLNKRYGEPPPLTAHNEVRGKPGFTGETPAARATAAGYPFCTVGEKAASLGHSATAAVDGLVNTVAHRTSMLSPLWTEFGFGMTEYGTTINLGRRNCADFVDVDRVIVSPGPGQVGVPAIFLPHTESPDPLPTLRPGDPDFAVGGPVSVGTYANFPPIYITTPATIDVFELTDQFGAKPALHRVNDDGWTYWMATQPLHAGHVYTVHVKGSFTGQLTGAFDLTWTFTTITAFEPVELIPWGSERRAEYLFAETSEPKGYFRFYTQTAGRSAYSSRNQLFVPGFRVEDFDDRYGETGFLAKFEAIGFSAQGVPNLGYPLSNVVSHRGVPIQFFQRGVMRRIGGSVQFPNIFDDLAKLPGVDNTLETVSRIPKAIDHPQDAGKSIDEIEARRLAELQQIAPAVHAFVTQFSPEERRARYGLPVNWQQYGDTVGVRFQRMGFRQKVGDTTPGAVDQVLGGAKPDFDSSKLFWP